MSQQQDTTKPVDFRTHLNSTNDAFMLSGSAHLGSLRSSQLSPEAEVRMSKAVLVAAQKVADELRTLQDECIRDSKLPDASRGLDKSWGRMLMFDTLLGKLQSEVSDDLESQQGSSGRGGDLKKKRAAMNRKVSEEWQGALYDNKQSRSEDLARRNEAAVQRGEAAARIQDVWRQHQTRIAFGKRLKEQLQASRKAAKIKLYKEAVERVSQARKLAFRRRNRLRKNLDPDDYEGASSWGDAADGSVSLDGGSSTRQPFDEEEFLDDGEGEGGGDREEESMGESGRSVASSGKTSQRSSSNWEAPGAPPSLKRSKTKPKPKVGRRLEELAYPRIVVEKKTATSPMGRVSASVRRTITRTASQIAGAVGGRLGTRAREADEMAPDESPTDLALAEVASKTQRMQSAVDNFEELEAMLHEWVSANRSTLDSLAMTGEMEQLDAMDPQLMADMEAKYQASEFLVGIASMWKTLKGSLLSAQRFIEDSIAAAGFDEEEGEEGEDTAFASSRSFVAEQATDLEERMQRLDAGKESKLWHVVSECIDSEDEEEMAQSSSPADHLRRMESVKLVKRSMSKVMVTSPSDAPRSQAASRRGSCLWIEKEDGLTSIRGEFAAQYLKDGEAAAADSNSPGNVAPSPADDTLSATPPAKVSSPGSTRGRPPRSVNVVTVPSAKADYQIPSPPQMNATEAASPTLDDGEVGNDGALGQQRAGGTAEDSSEDHRRARPSTRQRYEPRSTTDARRAAKKKQPRAPEVFVVPIVFDDGAAAPANIIGGTRCREDTAAAMINKLIVDSGAQRAPDAADKPKRDDAPVDISAARGGEATDAEEGVLQVSGVATSVGNARGRDGPSNSSPARIRGASSQGEQGGPSFMAPLADRNVDSRKTRSIVGQESGDPLLSESPLRRRAVSLGIDDGEEAVLEPRAPSPRLRPLTREPSGRPTVSCLSSTPAHGERLSLSGRRNSRQLQLRFDLQGTSGELGNDNATETANSDAPATMLVQTAGRRHIYPSSSIAPATDPAAGGPDGLPSPASPNSLSLRAQRISEMGDGDSRPHSRPLPDIPNRNMPPNAGTRAWSPTSTAGGTNLTRHLSRSLDLHTSPAGGRGSAPQFPPSPSSSGPACGGMRGRKSSSGNGVLGSAPGGVSPTTSGSGINTRRFKTLTSTDDVGIIAMEGRPASVAMVGGKEGGSSRNKGPMAVKDGRKRHTLSTSLPGLPARTSSKVASQYFGAEKQWYDFATTRASTPGALGGGVAAGSGVGTVPLSRGGRRHTVSSTTQPVGVGVPIGDAAACQQRRPSLSTSPPRNSNSPGATVPAIGRHLRPSVGPGPPQDPPVAPMFSPLGAFGGGEQQPAGAPSVRAPGTPMASRLQGRRHTVGGNGALTPTQPTTLRGHTSGGWPSLSTDPSSSGQRSAGVMKGMQQRRSAYADNNALWASLPLAVTSSQHSPSPPQ